MTQTVIPWGDKRAIKKWSADLAVDMLDKSYFNDKFIGRNTNSVIEEKTDLQSGAGDRVQFDLSAPLAGNPIAGDNRVRGSGDQLKFYSDEIIIDQVRKEVSAGGRMTRKRTLHDLRKVAKDRLSDYWAKWMDEVIFMYLAGARGINEDFIDDDMTFAGHADNPLRAPDDQHHMFGGDATSKATIVAADTMDRATIERVSTKARMLKAKDPKTSNMQPVKLGSQEHYVMVMTPFQEHDLRMSVGDASWNQARAAAAGAEGKNDPIFKGGLGLINNVVLHSHSSVIRFDDYGAGANINAARALFMGRQAGCMAVGMSGGRFSWHEEMEDRDNEPVVTCGTIIGISKTRFNNRDFGVMAVDTAETQL